MPTLLCFGDSNTHGSPPVPGPRYDRDTRWPCIAHVALGPDWHLVEEGLGGRTTMHRDPLSLAERDGRVGLQMALESHGPIDVLTIMLGTNDLKTRFDPTADRIAAGVAALLDIAQSPEMQDRHGGFGVLVISPPPILDCDTLSRELFGSVEVSRRMAARMAELASGRGAAFLDAGRVIESSPHDGVHFEPEAHHALGAAVAEAVRPLAG